jgi:hypothetical protein
MAGFCSSCGATLADGVKFCPACGGTAPGVGAPSVPPPASGGGGVVKIILIILGVVALLGVLMIGSCFYIGYRVNKAAKEMASTSKPYTGKKEPCSFVSAAEAADALGVPVQSAEPRGYGCDYAIGTDGSQHMMVQFTWQGGTTLLKLTHGALAHISAGMDTFTAVPGLGDEAYVGPGGSSIMMRKGDVLVNIDLRTAGLNAEGGKKVAALIAERLQP